MVTPLPFPPRPSPSPHPNPNPDPTLNRTTPFHPPARPIIIEKERSSQLPNDNALFQHVCFATNLGELTLIESSMILFAKHLCFVHTTHTPCPHHNTAMLGSAVLGKPNHPAAPTPPPPPTHHRPSYTPYPNNHNLQMDDTML